MQMFGGLGAYGPILQGFSKPVTDFSRAATIDDIIGNVSLCLLQGVENVV
jgi:Phosphotransacetylase